MFFMISKACSGPPNPASASATSGANQCVDSAPFMSGADSAHMKEDESTPRISPLVADAEAGFGGPLHAFEIMKNMIDAGAAGVHFEDQLASVKKCGHLGGKVLVPTSEFITKLVAARLATDVCGVDTILIARTDANSATLLTSDCDEYDQRFVTGERTAEGFFRVRDGVDAAI